MRSLWTAFKFLAAFPWPRRVTTTPQEIGQSTPFFPLVGFFLGLILVLFNRILEPYMESEILGVVLVVLLMLLTRARHLEGLGETFDAIGSRAGRDPTKSSSIGIFGFLAVMVVIMLKFRAIEVMGEVRGQGLLLAPVLSRWSMVISAYGSRPNQEGTGRIMVKQVRGRHLLWATALTLVLVILIAGSLGLWIALWVSLLALIAGLYFYRRFGGVSGDNFGAIAEIGEALAMVLFASL